MSSLKLLFLGLVLVIVLISCYLSSQLPGVTDTTVSSRHSESKKPTAHVQESAAKGVLSRLLPTHVSSFEFKIRSKDVCDGCFRISNYKSYSKSEQEIMIEGTTAVEITAGLYWYLKYWCGAHVSWDKTGGVQIASVPNQGSLPLVAEHGVEIQRPVPWNYYQNAVTSSYSFVWWDWTRWEKEIDWMALQGINLPLAFTGQEAIWQKVYLDFNMTADSLSNFFSGPAFLAWARMGNMHGWGGPLSQNWLNQQLVLQKKILARMVELGMTPVLPSFSGHVPEKLKEIFPSAKITRLSTWKTVDGDPCWCCNFLLYPSDPLFVDIGEAFIKKQIEEYGDVTDIYNCDTFNENHPPTNDPAFISALGAAIYKAMVKADKDAVWLMQGWIFYSGYRFWKPPQMKALLHSVPFGKMIVINLFAEARPLWNTSDQFYGTPYIWCMQHNFGGSLEMYGVLDVVASAPLDAWLSANSTMVGVGMCMEGVEQNPVVYELMSEMAFRINKVQTHVTDVLHKLSEWLKMYTRRRYAKSVHQVEEAWDILHGTVYNCTDGLHAHVVDFIVKLPDWDPTIASIISSNTSREGAEKNNPLPEAHLWYSTQDVVKALRLFLQGGSELSGSLTYRYDLVDLTRQVLSKLANQVYLEAVTAFRNKDEETLNYKSQKFKQIIVDMDELLATDENFLLGSWLESAKKLALNPTELKQYEWNARTQVTMWFDHTETNQSKLYDYANKFWSGTLKSYYLPRASSYFSHLTKSLQKKEPFNIVDWRKEWIAMSKKWQEGDELYPVTAKGDAFAISSALYEKYFGKGEGGHKNLGR